MLVVMTSITGICVVYKREFDVSYSVINWLNLIVVFGFGFARLTEFPLTKQQPTDWELWRDHKKLRIMQKKQEK